MDMQLSDEHRALSGKSREFCEQVLQPLELTVEENRGLPASERPALRESVLDWGFAAINHSREDGGAGYNLFEQTLINEQMGRATNGLWSCVWQPPICLRDATPAQKEKYLKPSCAGEIRGCYAITEPGAGSDPRQVKTSARKSGNGFIISGDKWFVTSFGASQFIIVHAHVDDDPDKPTLFLVDRNAQGVEHVRSPHFMHTWWSDHAELRFEDVQVDQSDMLGEVGQGFELTKDWFVEARIQIAAHTLGGAIRAAEAANAYADERIQFDRPIRDFQALEFMIADMATELMAAKSLLYRIASEIDAGMDRKRAHGRVSALKLFASEVAGRVVDKAVQIFGGRGYMRENPVERLYRDLRVDRIWEGTSEIQRAIIGGQIRKRGIDLYTDW